ncbi:MAG: hypothetical protein WKG00_10130 [Polyangiaceae bacterium]
MANWFIGLPISATAWLEALPPLPEGCRRFAAGDLHLAAAVVPPAAALRLDRVALYTWSADRALSLFRIVESAPLPKIT